MDGSIPGALRMAATVWVMVGLGYEKRVRQGKK